MEVVAMNSQSEMNVYSTRTTMMVVAAMSVMVLQMSFGSRACSTLIINKSSLYVGDLDPSMDEKQLYELFSEVTEVVSIRVCRDHKKNSSLHYSYVNFKTQRDATNAWEVLNFTTINGRPRRIMISHRDPTSFSILVTFKILRNMQFQIPTSTL